MLIHTSLEYPGINNCKDKYLPIMKMFHLLSNLKSIPTGFIVQDAEVISAFFQTLQQSNRAW